MSVGGTSSRLAFLREEERREGPERAAMMFGRLQYHLSDIPLRLVDFRAL